MSTHNYQSSDMHVDTENVSSLAQQKQDNLICFHLYSALGCNRADNNKPCKLCKCVCHTREKDMSASCGPLSWG